MPYFVWFGVLGLLLLYAAGITMFLAKRKNMPHLRRHHSVGQGGAFSLAVHAVLVLDHMGRSIPLLGGLGWLPFSECFSGTARFADAAGWQREMEPAAPESSFCPWLSLLFMLPG